MEHTLNIPQEMIEKGTMFENSLNNVERLLNLGMYRQSIKEYGSIIEQLLKHLYRGRGRCREHPILNFCKGPKV